MRLLPWLHTLCRQTYRFFTFVGNNAPYEQTPMRPSPQVLSFLA